MVNRGCSDQEIITRLRFVPGRNKTHASNRNCVLLYCVLLLVLLARMCFLHVCAPVCNCAGCCNADTHTHARARAHTHTHTTPRACRILIPQKYSISYTHMMSLVLPPALAFCLLMQTQAATSFRSSASAQCAVRFSGEHTETCSGALSTL
jgi:hypothetical protein